MGLGPGRQHAVQVVQAEHPRGRRPRAADRALAGAASTTPGGVRHQFHHVIDIAPDDLRGARRRRRPTSTAASSRCRCTGTSHRATRFAARPTRRRRKPVQYFEMCGHRGIWRRRLEGGDPPPRTGVPFDDDQWELYHLDDDFSECHDLAADEPEQARGAGRRCGGPRPRSTACCRSTTARSSCSGCCRSRLAPPDRLVPPAAPRATHPAHRRAVRAQPVLRHRGRRRTPRPATKACSSATAGSAAATCSTSSTDLVFEYDQGDVRRRSPPTARCRRARRARLPVRQDGHPEGHRGASSTASRPGRSRSPAPRRGAGHRGVRDRGRLVVAVEPELPGAVPLHRHHRRGPHRPGRRHRPGHRLGPHRRRGLRIEGPASRVRGPRPYELDRMRP